MSLWQKLKAINKGDFFVKAFPDYKVNKWIFNGALILSIGWLLMAAYAEDFDFSNKTSLKCPLGPSQCYNPLYQSPSCKLGEVCNREYLLPGETHGKDQSFWFKYSDAASLLMITGAVVINHLLYNRDFKIEVN